MTDKPKYYAKSNMVFVGPEFKGRHGLALGFAVAEADSAENAKKIAAMLVRHDAFVALGTELLDVLLPTKKSIDRYSQDALAAMQRLRRFVQEAKADE